MPSVSHLTRAELGCKPRSVDWEPYSFPQWAGPKARWADRAGRAAGKTPWCVGVAVGPLVLASPLELTGRSICSIPDFQPFFRRLKYFLNLLEIVLAKKGLLSRLMCSNEAGLIPH